MKRRLLQIHLLTALAGMLAFAGSMWANLTLVDVEVVRIDQVGGSDLARMSALKFSYVGWPLVAASSLPSNTAIFSNEVLDTWAIAANSRSVFLAPAVLPTVAMDRIEKLKPSFVWGKLRMLTLKDVREQDPAMEAEIVQQGDLTRPLQSWGEIYNRNIAINAAVALVTTLAVMVGIEWFLRRRERAKV